VQPRVGVGVFIFRDGKFLMGKRKGSHGQGSWSVPGGHLEFGETPEETATREVNEETGLKISNIHFAAITNDVFVDDKKHYITIWMTSNWKSGEPVVMEPDKYIDQQWFDFDTLPEPLFLPWEQLMKSEFYEDIKRQLETSRG
jgi:8-oxo-dGTP diphosphatase